MNTGAQRSVAQVKRELDNTSGLIYKILQQYRVKGERLQLSAEGAELRWLKQNLEVMKQERTFLKKPSKSSRGVSCEPLSAHR